MPSRNRIKIYVKDAYYHIYNRGVEKRNIFDNPQDYSVFLKYLKEGLSPPLKIKNLTKSFTLKGRSFKGVPRQPKNFLNKIELVCYCLMPNHIHLLIRQSDQRTMEGFMRSLLTRYSMYFNKKYDRVGSLFQGRYKATLIKREDYLLHLTRYIHRNPLEYVNDLTKAYSSYPDYLNLRKTKWVKPKIILEYFNNNKFTSDFKKTISYKKFVEGIEEDSEKVLGDLILE